MIKEAIVTTDLNLTRGDKMTSDEKLDLILEKLGKLDRLESDMRELRRQQMKDTAELKAMDSLILDEVERVHEIMLNRTDALKAKIG